MVTVRWAVRLAAAVAILAAGACRPLRGQGQTPPQPAPAEQKPVEVEPAVRCRDPQARDQDDMAIWVHPTDPPLSLIIASDKEAGCIFVYDLSGRTLQSVPTPAPGNIDVRRGFPLAGRKVDIVAVNQRAEPYKILVYAVSADSRRIERVDNGAILTGENYGGALYRSARTGRFYFITTSMGGTCEQYELADDGSGRVAGRKVRTWRVGFAEAAVADDQRGRIYVGEETKGVWEFGAEPDDPPDGRLVAPVGRDGLRADVEGLAIHPGVGGGPALVVSNQSRNRFNVYRLGGDFAYLGAFAVRGASDTDGIDIAAADLGGQFSGGLFACHTDAGGRPVLLVPWRRISEALERAGRVSASPSGGAGQTDIR